MQTEQPYSQHGLAEWTGAHAAVEKWLGRSAVRDSMMQYVGGGIMSLFGLVAMVVTCMTIAFLSVFLLGFVTAFFDILGVNVKVFRPVLFGLLFLLFMTLSVLHAYKTRWGTESAAKVDLGAAFSSIDSLGWEVLSAGPIMLILAGQDLSKAVRLSRMDVPHVSALLLWLFDKNDRAGFAEITLAFPELNAIRVLPQLRDLSGVNWWPDAGIISLSDSLQRELERVLGRRPKSLHGSNGFGSRRQGFKKPVLVVSDDMLAWYSALNLPPFATLPQVKSRYRKLAKKYHPDTRAAGRPGGDVSDDEQMKRINEAYHSILKNTVKHAGSTEW
jgi:hypothetical protein